MTQIAQLSPEPTDQAQAWMMAAVMRHFGGPEMLEVRRVPRPAPGAGEILVRVRAASINDWDWNLLRGTPFVNRLLNGVFRPRRRILGCDVAGRVEAVGSGASRYQAGDEVFGDVSSSGFGAFADFVCAPEIAFARKPAGMSFEQAAAIPQAGMLAVQGLIDVGRIAAGQEVLLNGAGGGVGTFALQLARLHGAVVTAVDSAGKLAMLRALGADRVVDFEREDFSRGGRRYDLILDAKTARWPWHYARVLKPGGVYVSVGGSMRLLLLALLISPVIRLCYRTRFRLVVLKPNKDLLYLAGLFEAGQLEAVIDGPYRLAEIEDAFRHYGTARHKGKIIVTMD